MLPLRARLAVFSALVCGLLLSVLSVVSYGVLGRRLDADVTMRLTELTDGLHGYLRFEHERPSVEHNDADGAQVALLFVDCGIVARIDGVWGYELGDEVRERLRARLKSEVLRAQDLIGDAGRDEFACVLAGVQGEGIATLAAETGGGVLTPDEVKLLPARLPNRAVTTVNPLTEPIWNTPLAFGLVVLLLTAEWIGRKLLRLV